MVMSDSGTGTPPGRRPGRPPRGRRQQLIDSGQVPGITSTDQAELVAARRRIAELEAEVEIHRQAAELLKQVVAPKDVTRRSL
jgi:hypothetical protein